MSVLFQSGVFEYQLPTLAGVPAGSSIVASNSGSLSFSEVYSGTCSVDFTGPVLAGCTLTIATCGRLAHVFLSAPSGEVLRFTVSGSTPQWGSLVNVEPAIPASLLPAGVAALGCLPLMEAGSAALTTLWASLVGTGTQLAAGLISMNSATELQAGTYVIGGNAQLSSDGSPTSAYLGSYVL